MIRGHRAVARVVGLACLVLALAGARRASAAEPSPSPAPSPVEVREQRVLAAVDRGDLPAAEAALREIVAIREAEDANGVPLADALTDLATVRGLQNDDAGAAEALGRSITVLRRHPASEVAGSMVARLDALAEHARRLGDFDSAEAHLREAIAVSGQWLPEDGAHARLLNNLGALLWDEHRYDEASALLFEALHVSEADEDADPGRLPVALHNLANLHREQGRLEEARDLHERALALARVRLAEDPRLAVFFEEAGVVRAALGEHAAAESLFTEALAVADANADPLAAAEIRLERGRSRRAIGRAAEAEEDLRTCLATRRRELGEEHPTTAQAEVEVALLGGIDEHTLLERALTTLDRTPVFAESRLAARAALAQEDYRAGRRDAAIARHLKTLDLADDLRAHRAASDVSRADWASRVSDVANEAIAWLVAAGRPEDALRVSERIRARVLDDQLRAAHVDWRLGLGPARREELETRERKARAAVAEARRRATERDGLGDKERRRREDELEAAVRTWRDVEEEIRAVSPALRRSLAPAAEDVVRTARARLPEGASCAVWQVGRESSHLFVVTKTDVRAVRLAVPPAIAEAWGVPAGDLSEATLERVLREGVATVGGGEASGLLAPTRGLGRLVAREEPAAAPPLSARLRELRRLADVLLPADVRPALLETSRLLVVPDGPLHRLPFEALILTEGPQGPVFWLDVAPSTTYAPSLATFVALAERDRQREGGKGGRKRRPGEALTVADPLQGTTPAPGELGPLPGAVREGQEFARAFADRGVVSLVGPAAREAAVKAELPKAAVVHLGTHGIVEQDRDDLLAALVLAPEPPAADEDGFLHLFEVYELPLSAEIVVLSACETKLGRRVRGEGVFALSRGFLAAGASRTVASLWSVNDEATAEVMERFFDRARDTGDWPGALRDAKRAVRAESRFADPFYWASFTISGVFP